MSRLSLLLVLAMTAFVAADMDYSYYNVDYSYYNSTTDKLMVVITRSSYVCPVPLIGQDCPKANLFFYYKCCGPLDKDCCLRPQNWFALVSLLVLSCLIGYTMGRICG